MNEKYSEQSKRLELVEKFKTKLNKEIDFILKRDLEEIKTFTFDEINKESEYCMDFETLLTEITVCLYFREWLDDYDFLLNYRYLNRNNDVIIYNISSYHLELWSQDNYNFIYNICQKIGNKILYISDDFLEFNFTNIFEEIKFNDKKEKERDEKKQQKS